MKLILDTSVLIAFYTELKRGYLLASLQKHGYVLLIPEYIVRNEIKTDLDMLYKVIEKGEIKILPQIRDEDVEELKFRFPSLNRRELEVIWWGKYFKSGGEKYLCVLDDGKARKTAQKWGIEIIGTLGIIEALNELGIINKDEREEICVKLRNKGFRMPKDYHC
ncbi:hypothetical protein C5S30_05385 [ANME-1 cluster archaeon GoMg4]|nr:hypothetical protein [ANME-1 cluster archaeon GoMg4]